MGANINGAGTNEIQIIGVKKLKDVSYNIMPDRIETGTFLCFAAATKGDLVLKNTNFSHIKPILNKLEETGCKLETQKNIIKINANKRLKAIDIKTMPYPGFPTDMQSVFASMLTTAKGTSIIVENIFENRYKYTQELNRMGAKIIVEGKSAIIRGTRKLYGAKVKATDLRGGAALVLAGLMANGITKVDNIEYIMRGYEDLDKKLNLIGANIQIQNI
jgi:UDP-N-acetylglucosamine 1-carboxyvinyltransferase